MFVTIRRYSPKNGAITKASMELLRRQIHDEFLPTIQKISGFLGYYLLNVDNRELVTLSFCATVEGAEQSTRCAAEYTLRNPLVFELGRPEVTEGEVLTYADVSLEIAMELGNGGGGGQAAAAALALWFEESRGMLLTTSER
jgi:hypothetical protein